MEHTFLEHTADIKFVASGKNLKEMFISSAEALNEIMCEKIQIGKKIEKTIEVSGHDTENLLYNFLEEFLFLLDTEDFILSKIEYISFEENNLRIKATLSGDFAKKYSFTNPVKAITYSEMKIENFQDKCTCTVVLDV